MSTTIASIAAGAALGGSGHAEDTARRAEVLDAAAALIGTSGLRTSMNDIARAAGIQAGSLYHHFASKEDLLVELLRRYHAELDHVARRALITLDEPATRPGFAEIAELGAAIARCAVAHRAAIQLSMYETPSTNLELVDWTARRPTAVLDAMHQTLRAARWSGYLTGDVDVGLLADRITQSMLQVGLGVLHHGARTDHVATLLCRIMLQGLATSPLNDAELDRSPAFLAARDAIAKWADEPDPTDTAAHARAVARPVVGRRGYEGTTVRDIAAAAGIGHGTVFRLIGSKDQLLASIMNGFGEKVESCSRRVLRTPSSPLEKVDALTWVNINALHRFGDEFRIQLAWMRQIPPDAPNPSVDFPMRLKQTKRLLSQGIRTGTVCTAVQSVDLLARCVIGLQWVPEHIVRDIGTRASLIHARDTTLRGVSVRTSR